MLTIDEYKDMKTLADHLLRTQKVFTSIYISSEVELALYTF